MVMSLHILMSPKLIHVSVLHYLGRLYSHVFVPHPDHWKGALRNATVSTSALNMQPAQLSIGQTRTWLTLREAWKH